MTKSVTANTVDDVALEPYDGVTITQDGTVLPFRRGFCRTEALTAATGAWRRLRASGIFCATRIRFMTISAGEAARTSAKTALYAALRAGIYTAFYNQRQTGKLPWKSIRRKRSPTRAIFSAIIRRSPGDAAALHDQGGAPYAVSGEFDFGLGYCGRSRFPEQALAADTDYVIKAAGTWAAYTVTANGEEFIRVVSAAVQYSTTAAQLCFGFDPGNNAWTGTIDLHNSLITVDGKGVLESVYGLFGNPAGRVGRRYRGFGRLELLL